MSDNYGGDAPRRRPDDPRSADLHGEAYTNPYADPFGHGPADDSEDAPGYRWPQEESRAAPRPVRDLAEQTTSVRPAYAPPGGAPAPSRRVRTKRRGFWLGFVLSFALLSLATCGSMAVALGLDELRISDFAGGDAVWTPPTLMPTPDAVPEVAADAGAGEAVAAGRFAPGQAVRNVTNSRVNVRRTPGHLGKAGDDVIVQIPAGDSIVILGETAGADNLTWWRVSFQGVEGWVAESTASGVQILGE